MKQPCSKDIETATIISQQAQHTWADAKQEAHIWSEDMKQRKKTLETYVKDLSTQAWEHRVTQESERRGRKAYAWRPPILKLAEKMPTAMNNSQGILAESEASNAMVAKED